MLVFAVFGLASYTEKQFSNVSERVLPKLSSILPRYIAANVWKNVGDIRDVISIGKLVRKLDGPQEIELIKKTMSRYGMEESTRL